MAETTSQYRKYLVPFSSWELLEIESTQGYQSANETIKKRVSRDVKEKQVRHKYEKEWEHKNIKFKILIVCSFKMKISLQYWWRVQIRCASSNSILLEYAWYD